jgi:hypothetical protein
VVCQGPKLSQHGQIPLIVCYHEQRPSRETGRTFWPFLLGTELEIAFAERSFRWSNLATKKAMVTVSIIGLDRRTTKKKKIYDAGMMQEVDLIGPYLVPYHDVIVAERNVPISSLNVWPAPSARGNSHLALVSLLQRIRSRVSSPAKMETRAARSS